MNKLLADEFYHLWSVPDARLSQAARIRQNELYYLVRQYWGVPRLDALRAAAAWAGNRDYPGEY